MGISSYPPQAINVTVPATVNQGNPGTSRWVVKDDYDNFETQHVTLVAGTDTTITFAQEVVMVRVTNWNTTNRVLVKNGAITSNTDASASRVGKAPSDDVPNEGVFLVKGSSIHIRSVGASEVTVEGFFRA